MKEIEDVNARVKGELLTKDDAVTAFTLLLEENDTKPIVFTQKELFKIFIDVKHGQNFAPEELEEWEIKTGEGILNKINNYVNRIKK